MSPHAQASRLADKATRRKFPDLEPWADPPNSLDREVAYYWERQYDAAMTFLARIALVKAA